MRISLFGIQGIPLGKHNVKDPRLDQAHKLAEAQKKTYAQVDVVEEKEMLTADAVLTSGLGRRMAAMSARLQSTPGTVVAAEFIETVGRTAAPVM